MLRFRLFSILLLSALPGILQSQPYCNIRTFDIRDGLAANTIAGIAQSPCGLIWLATWNGLCCYDGYQFTTFRSDSWVGADALSSNRISMIRPDSQENVWVRTYDGGLYLLDMRQCRFVNVGLMIEHRYGKTIRPRNFYALATGHTWITDELGEMNLRIDDRYPTDVERMEMTDIHKHLQAGRFIRKVEADANGREWLTTDRGKLIYGRWDKVYPLSAADDTNQPDTALAWRLEACGIKASEINKHFIDRQGNLWLTSAQGLTLVNFLQSHIRWTPLVDGQETRSVLCRHDGTLWAGSKDGHIGVFTTDGRQHGWLDTQGRITAARTPFANRIYAMKEDSQGYTWIGTKGEGLYVVTPQGVVHHYMPDAADSYSLSHSAIYDIDEDEQGNIWIGTYGGGLNLACRQPDGSIDFLHSGNQLKDYPMETFSRIRRITHNGQGVVLLSCTEGLVTFSSRERKFYCTRHHRQDTTSLRTSDVVQTLVTRDGNVYIATLGGGIQRTATKGLLHDNLTFRLVSELNRGAGNCLSLTEDRQGNIWVTREGEVCKYTPSTGQVERYSPQPSAESRKPLLTEGQPVLDRHGRLWIAAVGGLFTLDTKKELKSTFQPNIIFTNLLFQGEQHSSESQKLLALSPQPSALTIPKDRRNLTVSFAALDYGDHYLTEYAYRMDGEEAWNYIGGTPRISFSQLPPGLHTLEVKSTNADGVWGDRVATLRLDVTPYPWERTWVRLLLLILAVALATIVILIYIRHRQQTREREQRLERILRQYRELQESIEEPSTPKPKPSTISPQPSTIRYSLEEPKIVNEDEEMMRQLMAFIEQRISDEDLKVEDMAEAVNMGRTVFYEKVRSLVGTAPVDFLRRLRMQRAMQLISRSQLNVSQVAYSVGFTDPKYFSRCFKKETGMTPREYREKNKTEKGL